MVKAVSPIPKTPSKRQGQRGGRGAHIPVAKEWLPERAHKITLTRGKSKAVNSSGPTVTQKACQLRAQECNGMTPLARIKNPSENKQKTKLEMLWRRCDLCDQKTDMFCSGCKRFLCIDKDRSDVLADKYGSGQSDNMYCQEIGMGPVGRSVYKFKQKKIDQNKAGAEEIENIFAIRSCYHLAHEFQMDSFHSVASKDPCAYLRVVNPAAAEAARCYRLLQMEQAATKQKENIG